MKYLCGVGLDIKDKLIKLIFENLIINIWCVGCIMINEFEEVFSDDK